MKKRQVRCSVAFVDSHGVFNQKVFYTVGMAWLDLTLASCLNCGELFVVDNENPNAHGKSIKSIVGDLLCPNCGIQLKTSIENYPSTFRMKDGRIAHYDPSNATDAPVEEEVLVLWALPSSV